MASPCGSTNPYLHDDEEHSLFNHYLHIVERALSRSGDPDGNPFLFILLPMAASSDTVTSVIRGLSGCHWKRDYPGIWNWALARQGKAPMRGMACESGRRVLATAGDQPLGSTPEGKFCLQLFRYLDSMSTISRCKPTLLHEDTKLTDLTEDKSTGNFSTASVDTISGMTPVLLEILGMVNLLAAHRSRRVDELLELGFRTAVSHVRSELDSWVAEYNTAAIIGYQTSQFMKAFEGAVRLYLHQIVDGCDLNHELVGTAITPVLNTAMAIPYGSPPEGCLLFPLVIAGANIADVERRMLFKSRLMVMENTLGFGHISLTRKAIV